MRADRLYLQNRPALYEAALIEELWRRFGQDRLPLAGRYAIPALPRQPEILSANISFPEQIRTMALPCMTRHGPFASAVQELLQAAHEGVKSQLGAGPRGAEGQDWALVGEFRRECLGISRVPMKNT